MKTYDLARSRIEQIYNKLLVKNFFITPIHEKEYNFEFDVLADRKKLKVLVYFGKKGIKVVLQGDIESPLHKIIKNIINDQQSLDLGSQDLIEPDEYIGTDEVGKGDFFGPLVIAAVYVNPKTKKELLRIGIRDSKETSDYQIRELSGEIELIVMDNFEIVKINPAKYNELYAGLKNLNKLLDWGHSKAIDKLLDNTKCKFVITDKFSKKDLNVVTLSKHSDVEFVQETKAEKYIGVAAASILARATFLEWFDSHERKGLKIPRGSSEQVEIYARHLIKKIGKEKFQDLVKTHFKTFTKIIS